MVGGIIRRDEICDRDYGLLRKDFVRFLFDDVMRFGASNDFEVAGDSGDADFAGGEDGYLAGGGGVALRRDADIGGDYLDGVGVVAAEGESASAEFGDGTFSGMRGIETALGARGEAKAGVGNANVGGAADVGTYFFTRENACAFGERTLADMSEIRLEHHAKGRVLGC